MLFVAHKMNDAEFQADQMSLSLLNAGSRGPDLAYHYYFTEQTTGLHQFTSQLSRRCGSRVNGCEFPWLSVARLMMLNSPRAARHAYLHFIQLKGLGILSSVAWVHARPESTLTSTRAMVFSPAHANPQIV